MRRLAPLLPAFLIPLACGPSGGEGGAHRGSSAAERLDEARSHAARILPDSVLAEVSGLGYEPPFGDGLCQHWTYTFFSPQESSVLRLTLGPDGLFAPLGEPEPVRNGFSPPDWDGGFALDSDQVAQLARRAGAGRFFQTGTPVCERYHLCALSVENEVRPVWELTYTRHLPEAQLAKLGSDGGYESYTAFFDADDGRPLAPEDGADRARLFRLTPSLAEEGSPDEGAGR
ncbi:MAG TPA: hypothetical protein ENN88_01345 [Candidatus Coatesbacteria bacterium]|nr:hypothetical protein [Candidatus Coatesbacteria bacterium]